jgi:hypothetical protein
VAQAWCRDHTPPGVQKARKSLIHTGSAPWGGTSKRSALGRTASWAEHAIVGNGVVGAAKERRHITLSTALLAYVENNTGALIDYGERYEADRPASTSRVEGTVNHLVNARMNERQQRR